MAIEHSRKMQLLNELVKATAPSAEPDENYRPTHWSDRMYYLFSQVAPENVLGSLNWNQPARNIAGEICSHLAARRLEDFERFEEAVRQLLLSRNLDSQQTTGESRV